MPRICIFPKTSATGGVTSFQANLAEGLRRRGVQVCHALEDEPFDALLLTSATRRIPALLELRRKGIRIVQRLDGINWLHRRLRTGAAHFLKAEYANHLLAWLRRRVVSSIIYQSEFARGWWNRRFGELSAPSAVIHNSVDTSVFTPEGPGKRPQGVFRLLLVEGSLRGGYEIGLKTALALVENLAQQTAVELMIAGTVAPSLQREIEIHSKGSLLWAGLVPHAQIPALDRSAHLLYSADLNAACPNAVIEGMACGLPVAGFATGALPELVHGDAGRLVPYGGDPWVLDPPDISALVCAAREILEHNDHFRTSARLHALEAFQLETMVDQYLHALLD